MVLCSFNLNCPQIYGFLLARIRESPVDKGYYPGDDQEYSSDFHGCSPSFNLRTTMLAIFGRHSAFMQETL